MLVKFSQTYAIFTREPNDPKFYGNVHAKGEHSLFHFIKKFLNARGFNFIKTNMERERQMMGDKYQPLLRPASKNPGGLPDIALFSGFYQIRGANEDWNEGEVTLAMSRNYCGTDQNTDLKLLQVIENDKSKKISMECKVWASLIAPQN